MEIDDMVKMTKVCSYCGATSLYRRVRKGGYHCNKCKQTFDYPKVERVGEFFNSSTSNITINSTFNFCFDSNIRLQI
jgi:ribosomal protein L37AE/L43A